MLIAAVTELGVSGYFKGQAATDKGDWFMFDVALAVQNMVLEGQSPGLATVYIGFFDAGEAQRYSGCRQATP